MSLKMLIVLLSFAMLVNIMHCKKICLCCGSEPTVQDLTNCSDIGIMATKEEIKSLQNHCFTRFTTSQTNYRVDRDIYWASMSQFNPGTLNSKPFPTYDCNDVFGKLEGLIYRVLVDGSELFKRLDIGYFVGMKVDNDGNETPGLVTSTLFVTFDKQSTSQTTNFTRYFYIVRTPVSYKITNMTDIESSYNPYDYEDDEMSTEIVGEFEICNDKDENVNYELSLTERATTSIHFTAYDFYKTIRSSNTNSMIYDYSLSSKAYVIEITDNNTKYLTGLTEEYPYVQYVIEREYVTANKTSSIIPPYQCFYGQNTVVKKRISKKVNATLEINLGTLGNFTDTISINKNGTKVSLEIIEGYVINDIYTHHRGIIIISYNTLWFILGMVVGLIFFGLLLFIVVKTIGCVEKRNFSVDWERASERISSAAQFTEEKAAILGDRLVRLGDYICNVGTWVYQEIK